MAAKVVEERIKEKLLDLRCDFIGVQSMHRTNFHSDTLPYEVRLRVAGIAKTFLLALMVGEEVEALYTNGPAGGGGVRKQTNEVIGIVSVLIPENDVCQKLTIIEIE
jgi:hypothetical protein